MEFAPFWTVALERRWSDEPSGTRPLGWPVPTAELEARLGCWDLIEQWFNPRA